MAISKSISTSILIRVWIDILIANTYARNARQRMQGTIKARDGLVWFGMEDIVRRASPALTPSILLRVRGQNGGLGLVEVHECAAQDFFYRD